VRRRGTRQASASHSEASQVDKVEVQDRSTLLVANDQRSERSRGSVTSVHWALYVQVMCSAGRRHRADLARKLDDSQGRVVLIANFDVGWQSRRVWISDLLAVGLDTDPVVDRVSKALLTAKIPLGRLDGDVAEQKLDLLQFTSGITAQAGARPAEVMWG